MTNKDNNQTVCPNSDFNFLLGIILRFVITTDTSHLSHKILCVSPKMLHHLGKSASYIHYITKLMVYSESACPKTHGNRFSESVNRKSAKKFAGCTNWNSARFL